MNAITKFFHELFNPHCEHCAKLRKEIREEERQLREESKYCLSCDALGRENTRLANENERLLEKLLSEPKQPEQKVQSVENLKPINTTRTPFIPSAVRRQLLEKESRHTALLAKDAPKPDKQIDKDVELQELETELDNVRKERESQAVNH